MSAVVELIIYIYTPDLTDPSRERDLLSINNTDKYDDH